MTKLRSLKFLKFRPSEFQQLCELLSSVFQTSSEELAGLYRSLDRTCETEGWPPHFVKRSFFQSRDSQFQSIYEQSPSIAVDLPSILELGDETRKKPTIVILGQDPKGNQSHDQISLGTPYGLHHKGSREHLTSTKFYFEMIQVLMGLGYRVYLTDIFKIWVCNPQRLYSGIRLPTVDRNRCIELLEAELTALDPSAVITWGKPAADIIKKLNIKLHLAFPHPSGAANGAWKKLLSGQPPTRINKLIYWESSVRQVLGSK